MLLPAGTSRLQHQPVRWSDAWPLFLHAVFQDQAEFAILLPVPRQFSNRGTGCRIVQKLWQIVLKPGSLRLMWIARTSCRIPQQSFFPQQYLLYNWERLTGAS